MIDSQILKSKLHILHSVEYFLLPWASIYLVQLICLVSLKHVVGFPVPPALSAPISYTDLVCHSMNCLKYHYEGSGQVLSLL